MPRPPPAEPCPPPPEEEDARWQPPPVEQDDFSQLLQQLGQRHLREVELLQATVEDLQRRLHGTDGELPLQLEEGCSQALRLAPVLGEEEEVHDGTPWQTAVQHQDFLVAEAYTSREFKDVEPNKARDAEEDPLSQLPECVTTEEVVVTDGKHLEMQPVTWDSDGMASNVTSTVKPQHSALSRMLSGQPEHETECGRWTRVLNPVVGVCIFLNIIFMFLRLDLEGYQSAVRLGLEEPGKWPDLLSFFDAVQHILCFVFLTELITRLAVQKCSYFYSTRLELFNILDAFIVALTCIDLYILVPLAKGQDSDLTAVRAFRLFRVLRALRIVRTFEMFSKLRVLLSTVAASVMALFWSMLLLFLVMLTAGMIVCQLVGTYIEDGNLEDSTIVWLHKHYGTAGRSLWTMFELTFSGGWPNFVRPLVEELGVVFVFIFAMYVPMVVFAMTRICTALLLQETMACAANDAEMMIQTKMKEKQAYAKKLLDVFHAADLSGDGLITEDEFNIFMRSPKVKSYLSALELDTHETNNLFEMLDDGDGRITAQEFVDNALRLKGAAKSQDMMYMVKHFKSLSRGVQDIQEKWEKVRWEESLLSQAHKA